MQGLSHDPWIWIASLLSLCIFSFLYKDNPFYRAAEHIFVGVANGYFIAFMWHNVMVPNLLIPLRDAWNIMMTDGFSLRLFNPVHDANFFLILPTMIGLLYVTRFIPNMSWMIRIPIGITMGYFSAVAIPAVVEAQILAQMRASILLRSDFVGFFSGMHGFNTVVLFIGLLGTLIYFFFSVPHTGTLKVISKIGIVFVMIGFGASFGLTVMGRVALAIGRIVFLLKDWLGIVT
ncbi:hypothetical protein JXQ70_10095 [bacterium]|nr:hypothetical protein [bacterium]